MRSLSKKIALFVCCLLVSGVGTVFADASAISAMQDQIQALNQQIKNLESKMASSGSRTASGYVAPVGEGQSGGHLISAQDIYVGGHIDTQYNQNLTKGGSAIAGGNAGRIFDNDTESFTLNSVELQFIKEANPEGGAGFRFDVSFGEDAGVVNADGSGAADKTDVNQAYIEYVQPLNFWADSEILPDSVQFLVGRFETLAGFEVISGPDNWNISRSFAFGFSIPFVHQGVRMNFGLWDDYFDVYLGVNNGWGRPVDNNKEKVLEAAFGWSPMENVELFHSFYWGNDNADAGGYGAANGHRFLNTNTLTYQATDALTLATEINVGNERRVPIAATGTSAGENVTWHSYNFYTRYQVNDKDAVTYRFELYRDQESFTTGLDRTLTGHTLTYEHSLADNLIARAEYRLDHCNGNDSAVGAGNCFTGGDSAQQTIGGQLLYLIG